MDGKALWDVQETGSITSMTNNCAVRVVIILKSGIKTNNGTGSSGSPFELVV